MPVSRKASGRKFNSATTAHRLWPSGRCHCQARIPYVEGFYEKLTKLLGRFDIRCIGVPANNLGSKIARNAPYRDKYKQRNVVYRLPCADCDQVYIGETCRRLGVRVNEHKCCVATRKVTSNAVARHCVDTGHGINWQGVEIVARESNDGKRRIAETFWIRQSSCFNGTEASSYLNNTWLRLKNF